MARRSKILVPTDFSEMANRAVKYGAQLAETNRARLILLTVIGDLPWKSFALRKTPARI